MNHIYVLLGALWLGLAPVYANTPEAEARIQAVLWRECQNDPCVVRWNGGGNLFAFEEAAVAIHQGARKQLIIDGFCASACMVLADRLRHKVCITRKAVFGYHLTNFNQPLPLRPDLMRWIASRGGFPPFSSLKQMAFHEAVKFWRACR